MGRLLETPVGGLTYVEAGVDIDEGDAAVRRITAAVETTRRPEVLSSLGGFSGLFHLDRAKYVDPVLVASADGVGTKIEVARLLDRFDTIGRDLVAMLVDDLVCVGAEPLFLLDYLVVGKLDSRRVQEVVEGIAEGCRACGAALLGGETAEHGAVMESDGIDVAGFAVGVLEKGHELGPHRVREGDVIVGLASPNLRSNGFALARRALIDRPTRLDEPAWEGASRTLGEELLAPSVIYAPAVLDVTRELAGAVHAAAHITGGGIVGNVPRVLPDGLDAVIEMGQFETPEIFLEIQRRGHVDAAEMVKVFNCGLGLVLIVDRDAAEAAVSTLRARGVNSTVVGKIVPGTRTVVLR